VSGEDNLPSEGAPRPVGISARIIDLIHILTWFFFDWRFSRDWKNLAGGIPAILVGGAALIILLIGRGTSQSTWLSGYAQAAATSLEHKDYAAAEVYYHRVAMLDDAAPATIYGMALAAAGREDLDRARGLMRQIAPASGGGYPPAHLWLAKEMLVRGKQLAPSENQILEQHLLKSLAGDTQNNESHALLGYFYASRGDAAHAIPHLEEAAKARPELMASLAVVYMQHKDDRAAKNAALKARDFFVHKTETEPEVLENRLQWGLTELLLQNYEQAVRVLQPGLASKDPKRFHDTLAGVYLAWYEATPANQSDGLAKRMELLKFALDHGPNNPQVLAILTELTTGDSGNADEARTALEKVLAKGKAPAIVHAILGTRALQKGDTAKARMHLELAYQGDPRMPVVLNNLAWILATQQKPDLEHALALAENAKALSNDPEFSATLGTILFRLGRHREAVKELEIATAAFPRRTRIHEELAMCYEKLGDAGLAKLHRGLAEDQKSRPVKPTE
jgi:Tfp pilus assembly protein PilF